MRMLLMFTTSCFIASVFLNPAKAGVEVVASKSLTVQSSGPRSGDAGSKYFNVQGKDNEKYASFGVLVFDIPSGIKEKTVKSVTLTLVQSVPKFAKDGAIRFFLASDSEVSKDLKFDLSVSDGVGNQIKSLHALGSGQFKKVETGNSESFSLALDDGARARIAKGGKLCLVIVPAEGAVAATYFGANEADQEKSPRMAFELP